MNSRKRLLSSDHPSHSMTDALPCCFRALELGPLDPKASSLRGAGQGDGGRVGSIPQGGAKTSAVLGLWDVNLLPHKEPGAPFPPPWSAPHRAVRSPAHTEIMFAPSPPTTPTGRSPQESEEKGRQHLVVRHVATLTDGWVEPSGLLGGRVRVGSSQAGRESPRTPCAPKHASSPHLGRLPLHLGLSLL